MQRYALITGGLGFIGSHITRMLLDQHHIDKVVCLDHFGRYVDSTNPRFNDYRKLRTRGIEDKIIIERGEAKFYSVLQKVISKYRPLYIFHLSALPLAKLDNLNAEEALEGTVMSTTNILEILGGFDDYKPKKFVYASSSMVYGDFLTDVATEDHPTKPKEIYGTMKLAGEIVARGLGSFHKIPYTIIRPSAVYGPTDMNRRATQIFIEKAMNGETISIHGKDEKLDFTYVKDVAKGFIMAAIDDKADGETFNITHGKGHTLIEFVECLKKYFPELHYEIQERDAFRPKRGTLSIEKAKSMLGYQPDYSLQAGVDEYMKYLEDNKPGQSE